MVLLLVRQVEPKEDLKKVKDVKALWIFVDQGLDLCRFCSTGKTPRQQSQVPKRPKRLKQAKNPTLKQNHNGGGQGG